MMPKKGERNSRINKIKNIVLVLLSGNESQKDMKLPIAPHRIAPPIGYAHKSHAFDFHIFLKRIPL